MENYRPFTEKDVVAYMQSFSQFFPNHAELVCKEIGDGNLNMVFRVIDQRSGQSIILKQALPYPRVVGDSWPLTLDRVRIEAEALEIQAHYAPGLVPKLYHYDEKFALVVMEDLSDHIILRKSLITGKIYPQIANDLAEYLANTLFFTSDYYLKSEQKKIKQAQFINPEMCKMTEKLVFTDPYFNAETNSFNPLIQRHIEKIWKSHLLKKEIAQLKLAFMTKAQALIHGDLHSGSIMVKENSTKVIDPEFAFFGPMGFDMGALFANILLSYISQEAHIANSHARKEYQSWLLWLIEEIWHRFTEKFRMHWAMYVKDEIFSVSGFVDEVIRETLQDTAGFAGCKMMRRVIGLASLPDFDVIDDQELRAKLESAALLIGQYLVLDRKNISQISDLIAVIEKVKSS
ncbi:S-methyl-5-thioribose kinase [Thermoflavimicrobium daqui]|uniref:Methylthioribose kinase n=1 Tax=Thermoflavimicrobium daqui TaxID=2137476 RepID=A0A364K0S0_9BACL|nr:S-methyl-5-thioribose kinase [Thermoflavimicrobium daqui]RAL21103.1 S-methyl-5-thioribose kinase [Thermoflavimicrobium daqui]